MKSFKLFPPVLKTIMIVNLAIFVLQHFLLATFTIGGVPIDRLIVHYFALQPLFDGTSFISGSNFYPWQLISYQFLHAGFWHIFFNLFVLWMFGSELENEWGSGKFLTFYLIAGMGAGLVQLFISPMLGSIAPTVGASGAVYGVLLAFGLTNPERPIFMFPFFIPIKAKYFVLIMIGIELIFGFSVSDSVARFAHLGGAATGFLLLKFGDRIGIYKFAEKFFKNRPIQSTSFDMGSYRNESTFETRFHRFTRQEEQPTRNEPPIFVRNVPKDEKVVINLNGEDITQARIDEILDKISEKGYQSLSEKDKYILTELSKRL